MSTEGELKLDTRRRGALATFVDDLVLDQLLFANLQLGMPWAIAKEDPASVTLHLVREGKASLRSAGASVELGIGDVVMVTGSDHHLGQGEAPIEFPEFHEGGESHCVKTLGADGEVSSLLCMAIQMAPPSQKMLSILPNCIILRASKESSGPQLIELLHKQASAVNSPERIGLATSMAKTLLLAVIESTLGDSEEQGLFGAVADDKLRQAVEALQQDLSKGWTVRGLAEAAGMSRAAFSSEFTRKVGTTPMKYVHLLRMARAVQLLGNSSKNLSEIGDEIGYSDPTSFSRAFRQEFGHPPREYRRFLTNVSSDSPSQ